jgi:hypothetical protein
MVGGILSTYIHTLSGQTAEFINVTADRTAIYQ